MKTLLIITQLSLILLNLNACMRRQKTRLQDLKMYEIININDLHPDSLKEINPYTVRRVMLRDINLDTVPQEIEHFISAKELNLSNNNISELPEFIRRMTHLEELNIAKNPIKKLPYWIHELRHLKSIIFYDTQMDEFPEVLLSLDSLEVISCSSNPFKALPEQLCELINLRKFYMTNSQVESLPKNFGNLENLERLSFSRSKKILDFPASFAKLKQLKDLYLEEMEFTELPEEICELTNLEQLSLSRKYLMEDATPLKTLPSCIGNLVKLRDLFIKDCAMESLPKEIGKLKSLELLQVEQNYLRVMHKEWVNLPDNMVFQWQGNPWSEVPEELNDVKWHNGLPRRRFR